MGRKIRLPGRGIVDSKRPLTSELGNAKTALHARITRSRRIRRLLSVTLLAAGAFIPTALFAAPWSKPSMSSPTTCGRIYKWVDENGQTHYGQSIPPKYRNQAAEEMNKNGLTIRRIEKVTPGESPETAAARAQQKADEQKQRTLQARRDLALINTYTSADEIEEAKERNLAVPLQALRGLEPRRKAAEDKLKSLQTAASSLEQKGTAVPEYLQEDIAASKREVEALRTSVERFRAQIAAIRTRFEKDKQRYIELTDAR